jgi:hypothetical protein
MRLPIWLTALLLILAVSAVGLATTASAAGPQATAAKKKGCKKGYVKKKTAKGTKCVKKKAAPKKVSGNAKLPADGQYTLAGADVYISGKQTSVLVRASIPKAEMQCASGTPSRSNGLVSITLPLAANGAFSGSSDSSGSPVDAAGQFTSATQLKVTITARDVQGGNTAADLCSGTKTLSGVLTKK